MRRLGSHANAGARALTLVGMHTRLHTCVRVYVHDMIWDMGIRSQMYTCVNVFIHATIHTETNSHGRINLNVHTYIQIDIYAYTHIYQIQHPCICLHTYIHAYMYTYIYTCVRKSYFFSDKLAIVVTCKQNDPCERGRTGG